MGHHRRVRTAAYLQRSLASENASVVACLLRAVDFVRREDFACARNEIALAATAADGNPATSVVMGLLAYASHDYARGLELLVAASEVSPELLLFQCRWRVACAGVLGWEAEAVHAAQLGAQQAPHDESWPLLAAAAYVRGDCPLRAAKCLAGACERQPSSVRFRAEWAHLLARGGERELAVQHAKHALELANDANRNVVSAGVAAEDSQQNLSLGIANILLDAGEIEFAREVLERALVDRGENPVDRGENRAAVVSLLGELALWEGDLVAASKRANELIVDDEFCVAGHRLLGAVAVLQSRFEDAIRHLEYGLELVGGGQAAADYLLTLWRAEAAIRSGDGATAHALLPRASEQAESFLPSVWLLRLLLKRLQGDSTRQVSMAAVEEVFDLMSEVCPDMELGNRATISDAADWAEATLKAMRGNRSVYPTRTIAGRLVRLQVSTGPRHASRQALQRIRTLSAKASLAGFDSVIRRFPDSSLPLCHRGELKLWLGDLVGARADLEAALEIRTQTRWAHIGLTGIDMLEGDLDRALETCKRGIEIMGGTQGPSVFIYRGEVLRRLGRLPEAKCDLERAQQASPRRMSVWPNLALLYGEIGDLAASRSAFSRFVELAPQLVSDAARETQIMIWGDRGYLAPPSAISVVSEHALHMMRGNRSSTCQTYLTAAGQLRAVGPRDDSSLSPFGDQDALLLWLRRLLRQALATSSSAAVAGGRE